MSTHTPGPWRVAFNWRYKMSVTNGKERICNLPHINLANDGPMNEDKAEATIGYANARLIAAAPELLMALKDTAAYADAGRLSYNDDELRPLLERMRNMARAAIAKATGEK